MIDDRTLEALYRAIGARSCGRPVPCFETAEAREIGVQVLGELNRARAAATEEE